MQPLFDFLVFGQGQPLHQHVSHLFFLLFPLASSVDLFSEFAAAFDLLQFVVWRGCHPLILEPQLEDLPQLMNFLKME